MKLFPFFTLGVFFLAVSPAFSESSSEQQSPTHGIAIYGDLKYPEGFTHFDYVNPNAPKGGEVRLGAFGSFDSFNSFIIKGNPAIGVTMLHCSLLKHSGDEPFSMYGYLADKILYAPDHKSVTFGLNKNARFSDGTPVIADDVVFSFNTLIKKGAPHFQQYYNDVAKVEKINDHEVRFTFKTDANRELPLILGEMPVFSKAYYTKHDFEKSSLTPPVGCGPYVVDKFDAGQTVHYKRVKNWWGENLPSQKGQNNFDVTYVYYRDQNVLFEAFKAGDHDFRAENISKNWVQGYDIPAVKEGKLIKQETPDKLPKGVQLAVFNMRKPIFQDRKVREALTKAFDYEWVNKNLFYNLYTRANSYFNNSPQASSGIPQGEELKILEAYKDKLPPEIFTKEFKLPVTNGSGYNRKQIAEADKLLTEAGWIVKNGKRVNAKTGKPFEFEYLMADPAYERVVLAMQRNFAKLGIKMHVRSVTPSQYIEKLGNFDFDMIGFVYLESENPGNEQRGFWGSKSGKTPEGYNFAGINSPVIDDLIELLIDSPTREDLNARTRALDRVLLWGYYGIPEWYSNINRIAYWNKFGKPKIKPKDGIGFSAWWIDPALEKKLKR